MSIMSQVVSFLVSQGCGNVQEMDNVVFFTCPNGVSGMISLYDNGLIQEVIDGDEHSHANLDQLKAAWLEGTNV
jgi:hypothetical protein